MVNKQKEEQPQKDKEIKPNDGEIEELERQKIKAQNSGLIEKRRNAEMNRIQSQIDHLKKDDDGLTITY